MKKLIIKVISYLLVLGLGVWIGVYGIKMILGNADFDTKLPSLENKNVSLDDLNGIYLSDTNKNSNSSKIAFIIKETLGDTTFGKFDQFKIQLNAHEDFTQSEISVSIDAASINTANSSRDKHLLAEDFFHTDKFPEIKFTTNAIAFYPQNNSIDYISTGKLQMLGVEKYLNIQFNLEGTSKKNGKETAVFKGEFSFDRTQFGMSKDNDIDNIVTVSFLTELTKQ